MFHFDPYRPSTGFEPIIYLMRVFGAWWPANPSRLQRVYPLAAFYILSLTLLGQLFFCWKIRNDLDALLNAVFLNMSYMALIFKLRNWHRVFQRVQHQIFYTCNAPSFIPTSDTELRIVCEATAKMQKLFVLINIGAGFFLIFVIATPLFTGEFRNYMLPLQAYYFFETQTVGRYVAMYMWQIVGLMMSAPIYHSIDSIVIGLMTMAVVQIRILGERLARIGRSARGSHAVEAELRQCIVFYQKTVAFVAEIQDTFESPLFVQVACTSVVICATGYKLFQAAPGSLEFLSLTFYMVVMNLQLSAYCWMATELTTASDRLGWSAYDSDFMGFGEQRSRRKLMMCMQMMQRPLRISANGLFRIELSIRLYMLVVKTSYSNLMVLNEMNVD